MDLTQALYVKYFRSCKGLFQKLNIVFKLAIYGFVRSYVCIFSKLKVVLLIRTIFLVNYKIRVPRPLYQASDNTAYIYLVLSEIWVRCCASPSSCEDEYLYGLD